MVENRLVGIKSREIYEAPGAMCLYKAYNDLASLTLDKYTYQYLIGHVSNTYANLVYEGLWFSPLREALDAFNNNISKYINGTVRLKAIQR